MESTALFGLIAIAFCTAERLVSAYSVERIGGHEHIGDSQAIDLNRKIVVLIFDNPIDCVCKLVCII